MNLIASGAWRVNTISGNFAESERIHCIPLPTPLALFFTFTPLFKSLFFSYHSPTPHTTACYLKHSLIIYTALESPWLKLRTFSTMLYMLES